MRSSQEVRPDASDAELKANINARSPALDMPFLLLPFRPASDPSAARSFIRNFFNEERGPLRGQQLEQELMLTEPIVSALQEGYERDLRE